MDVILEPADNQRLANLCGQFDEHLRQIERRLGVEVNNRGNHFRVIGDKPSVQAAEGVLRQLYVETENEVLDPTSINLALQASGVDALVAKGPGADAVAMEVSLLVGRLTYLFRDWLGLIS